MMRGRKREHMFGPEHVTWTSVSAWGAYRLDSHPVSDARGDWTRIACQVELAPLHFRSVQVNISHTRSKGTIRGLHYQRGLTKIVYVVDGEILDVVGNQGSGETAKVKLSANQGVYVPAGMLHGFQALTDNVTMIYLYDAYYAPAEEGGVHYLSYGLKWPLEPTNVSARDAAFPRRR